MIRSALLLRRGRPRRGSVRRREGTGGPRWQGRHRRRLDPPQGHRVGPRDQNTRTSRRLCPLPEEQEALARLPEGSGCRMADRYRSRRGRRSTFGPGSHGRHRRPLVGHRSRSHPQATSGALERRLARVLPLPPGTRAPPRSRIALRRWCHPQSRVTVSLQRSHTHSNPSTPLLAELPSCPRAQPPSLAAVRSRSATPH